MKGYRLALLLVLGAGLSVSAREKQPAGGETVLAGRAREVLRRHCFSCHGQDPRKVRADLKILDRAVLLGGERKLVVPKAPGESKVLQKIEGEAMPPGRRPKVPATERQVLREWIEAGAPPFPGEAQAPNGGAADKAATAARVKELFRTHCFECHGGSKGTAKGVRILDYDGLLRKKKIVPGKPEESALFGRLTDRDDPMPPPPNSPLKPEEVALVRAWIAEGAQPFPPNLPKKDEAVLVKDSGSEYVSKKILEYVLTVEETRRPFLRFFSINHLLSADVTPLKLDRHRAALAKAVNHLSWKETLVRPLSIDKPVNSIYVVDIHELGWDKNPFEVKGKGRLVRSDLNLFDLVLLEYPYGSVDLNSETFERLAKEFLLPARQVRPVAYVRADWFASVATQPPLYEDLLQLPREVKELEKKLGIHAEADLAALDEEGPARVWRAGMTSSQVSRNNRIVERHTTPDRGGYYWKSFDYRSSTGRDNIFKDPLDLHPAGGEIIFSLPNKLQGYFLANGNGVRVESAPTEIVTDKFASDRVVRNGLSCMRCHDSGMIRFEDAIRPAVENLLGTGGLDTRKILKLYPRRQEMSLLVTADGARFQGALKDLLGNAGTEEPLRDVSKWFEDPLSLSAAARELGLTKPARLQGRFDSKEFAALGLMPLAAGGVVRRDTWEDYYDQVIAGLTLGVPLVPLDGLTRREFQPTPALDVKLFTNKRGNVFEPGEGLEVFVKNNSRQEIFIELFLTNIAGTPLSLPLADNRVLPGKTLRFPPEGKEIPIKGKVGTERITLFASTTRFPPGEVLKGKDVAGRIVHSFYRLSSDGKRLRLDNDASRILKKSIVIETR